MQIAVSRDRDCYVPCVCMCVRGGAGAIHLANRFLRRQELEKHQRQRYVDDQYHQNQLLPREPIL
jgi:hypothetical protein